ncbi:hypothetical protein KO516_11530 [Citreicella sp. C3M06]|uniref:hypothetical protein n=1 Tax=Citreicella sp. C3M06 TaxID=2841564 RepID=UPI001C09D4F5|nr:hypothetical protein [Citreicella sp. C3M06]MBU2961440.1 hypothetical protein [Citreicella sp. C3M06]
MSFLDVTASRRPPLSADRLASVVLIVLVAALSLLGPLILPGDPVAQSLMKALTGPEAAAPLGYDHPGRSVFCRLADALLALPGLLAMEPWTGTRLAAKDPAMPSPARPRRSCPLPPSGSCMWEGVRQRPNWG